MTNPHESKGWQVVIAGTGINLALGVLYAWSVVAKQLIGQWGWSAGQASLPYALAVGVFAVSMVFAGRAQDRFGPRIVATLGGIFALLISGTPGKGRQSLAGLSVHGLVQPLMILGRIIWWAGQRLVGFW